MRLFIFSLLFAVSSLAADEPVEYGHGGAFGVRVTGGGAIYVGGIDNTVNQTAADNGRVDIPNSNKRSVADYTKYIAAGWSVPLQLELTYGFTNAFEVLVGVRYGFSKALTGDDKYIMESVGAALGYRYYLNTQDPIQAYMSGQLAMDLAKFIRLEGKSAVGFLFEITPMIGVFLEGNLMLAGMYNSNNDMGKGAQVAAGLATGLHLHF